MAEPRLNIALIDGRLGTAWCWHPYGSGAFYQYDATLDAQAVHLSRASTTPLKVFGTAANVTEALPLLSVASTRTYPDHGITGFARLALALWDERSQRAYLGRIDGIRRATYSGTGPLLTVHVDNAVPPVARMGAFAHALERMLARYESDASPPAVPAQRLKVIA